MAYTKSKNEEQIIERLKQLCGYLCQFNDETGWGAHWLLMPGLADKINIAIAIDGVDGVDRFEDVRKQAEVLRYHAVALEEAKLAMMKIIQEHISKNREK